MKSSKLILLAVASASLALLGAALYMQHVLHMLPCPLCVIQRYAFAVIALICLVSLVLPHRAARLGAGVGMLAATAGAGVAIWHWWVKLHPSVSCGIDPLETSLNRIVTAKLLPSLFYADGLCTTPYAPLLGLSLPQWALIWFIVFAVALGVTAFCRRR